jgi:hypothetical protein
MMNEVKLIGAISAHREEVRPLSERQKTKLVENFASQAVVAIENTTQGNAFAKHRNRNDPSPS